MLDQIPYDIAQLLLFTIPGFFIVWSFRKTAGSKQIAEFEYLMFSAFWGVILLGFLGFSISKETLTLALSNPYSACIIFSTLGVFFGGIAGTFFRDRELLKIVCSRVIKKVKIITRL
jgi:hypothetical protein